MPAMQTGQTAGESRRRCRQEIIQAAMDAGCCQDIPGEALLDRLGAETRAHTDIRCHDANNEGIQG